MGTEPIIESPTIFERLAEPFPADCVEWRANHVDKSGRRALALAYVDARSVMIRLDEVLGPQNWSETYRHEGGRMMCRLSLRIDGEWVAKEDGSGDSNFEGEKGGISGAFKRAAVKWGIGRYLYDVDAIWADCEAYQAKGKWVWKAWTPRGQHDIDAALKRFKGARTTGKPVSVELMLSLIDRAEDVPALRRLHGDHWAAIPIDYRKEVLEALDRRREEIRRQQGRND